jgi:hypothetical protein
MSDLLPCPFCGCKADLIDENLPHPYMAYCRDCRIQTPNCSTHEGAEKLWNKRTLNEFDEYKEKNKKKLEDYEFAWDEGYREGYKAGIKEANQK